MADKRFCGAKTRAGTSCKRPATIRIVYHDKPKPGFTISNGLCYLHDGKPRLSKVYIDGR